LKRQGVFAGRGVDAGFGVGVTKSAKLCITSIVTIMGGFKSGLVLG
jgi:hypothetical protein